MTNDLIIGIASTLAAGISAIGSITIALMVHRFSRQFSRAETTRQINSQWQTWNLSILTSPELAAFIAETKKKQGGQVYTSQQERMAAATFFQLNMLYDTLLAKEAGIIDEEFVLSLFTDCNKYLFLDNDILQTILQDRYGYPDRFIQLIKDRFPRASESTVSPA
ncbi:MAG: hypothetical protein WDN08_14905 [Rhizomicrobium sp.]